MKLGVSNGYLSRLFSGKIDLKFDHIVEISRVIGFEPEEMLHLAYPAPRKPPSQSAARYQELVGGPAARIERRTGRSPPGSPHRARGRGRPRRPIAPETPRRPGAKSRRDRRGRRKDRGADAAEVFREPGPGEGAGGVGVLPAAQLEEGVRILFAPAKEIRDILYPFPINSPDLERRAESDHGSSASRSIPKA